MRTLKKNLWCDHIFDVIKFSDTKNYFLHILASNI